MRNNIRRQFKKLKCRKYYALRTIFSIKSNHKVVIFLRKSLGFYNSSFVLMPNKLKFVPYIRMQRTRRIENLPCLSYERWLVKTKILTTATDMIVSITFRLPETLSQDFQMRSLKFSTMRPRDLYFLIWVLVPIWGNDLI